MKFTKIMNYLFQSLKYLQSKAKICNSVLHVCSTIRVMSKGLRQCWHYTY